MAVFLGFIGPSYVQRSVNVATDRAMNLYTEAQTVPGGKTQVAMYGRCGIDPWLTLGGTGVPWLFAQNGRAVAVIDGIVYELYARRDALARGSMEYDETPVTISSNGSQGNQWFLTSAKRGYIFNLVSGAVTQISDASFRPTKMGFFTDGYFGSLIDNSNSFQISNLEDGTNWSSGSAGTAVRSEASDDLVACIVDHRYIWTLGSQKSLVYYNAGTTFPFAPLPSIFVETGCAAAFSPVQIDNGLCWLAQSARGARYAVRADGPTPSPTRISTPGVEWLWEQYARVDDAVGFGVEWQGHSQWYLNFPTAGATWVYDASQPPQYAWHEEGLWDSANAVYQAYPGRSHCFAFGQHLVGCPGGRIGVLNPNSFADFGVPIRWFRRTAHICGEQVRQIHDRIQVDLETGVGLTSDVAQGFDPKVMLRWSDDGGHQWSNEKEMGIGKLGNYKYRAFFTRMGLTRDRVYEVAGSDPVKTALIAAYLNVRGGRS